MAADEGDITLRDVWGSVESMRTELTNKIDGLADEVRGNVCTQRKECDEKMEAHDKELASHSARLTRFGFHHLGCGHRLRRQPVAVVLTHGRGGPWIRAVNHLPFSHLVVCFLF